MLRSSQWCREHSYSNSGEGERAVVRKGRFLGGGVIWADLDLWVRLH